MKGTNIGELEELVLLTVGILYKNAYGIAVMDEIEKETGRRLAISAVHTVLTRLEDKGLLKSQMSDPTNERGGRRKKIFAMTALGKRTLEELNGMRNSLYNKIPKMAWQLKAI